MFRKVLIAVALSAVAVPALAAPGNEAVPASAQPEARPAAAYSLQALREMARATHPSVAAAEAYVEAGRAQLTTAGAYPNPEVEFMAGRSSARMPGVVAGSTQSLALTQRLDNPWQRDARLGAARFGLEAREAERRGLQNDLLARLDQRFFDMLRRQAELRASQEDLGIAEQIRSKVAVRVNTGESPRFELIKADTELLNAQKAAESASLRIAQARAALRSVVGPTLPADFQVDGSLTRSPVVPPSMSCGPKCWRATPSSCAARPRCAGPSASSSSSACAASRRWP
jgi:cobalt-zinc-cadmium efflux system outer membrane protein